MKYECICIEYNVRSRTRAHTAYHSIEFIDCRIQILSPLSPCVSVVVNNITYSLHASSGRSLCNEESIKQFLVFLFVNSCELYELWTLSVIPRFPTAMDKQCIASRGQIACVKWIERWQWIFQNYVPSFCLLHWVIRKTIYRNRTTYDTLFTI